MTVRVKVIDAAAPAASVAVTVNVDVPVVLGAVPANFPVAALSETHAGAPDIDHVNGAVPPLAVSVWFRFLVAFTVADVGAIVATGLIVTE